MGVNAARCRSVEPAQDAMQVLGPMLLGAAAQFVAQFFGPLRTGKESFDQSAEIESGSSADNRQAPALLDLAQNLPRLASIFSRANVGERIDAIQQVMRNFRALRRAGLGRADFKFAVHRNRVAVDDFTAKAARDRQRQSGLPARRRTKHDDHQRLAVNFANLGNFANFSARSKECTASSG